MGQKRCGTEYTSTAPDQIEVNGIWARVGEGNISHLVTDNANTITIHYEKLMSETDVVIKYVEAGNHGNVLVSMPVGKMQVGSTYNFSVSSTFDHGGMWTIVGSTNRTYIVALNDNNILIELDESELIIIKDKEFWVFGGVERKKEKKMFLLKITDRTSLFY